MHDLADIYHNWDIFPEWMAEAPGSTGAGMHKIAIHKHHPRFIQNPRCGRCSVGLPSHGNRSAVRRFSAAGYHCYPPWRNSGRISQVRSPQPRWPCNGDRTGFSRYCRAPHRNCEGIAHTETYAANPELCKCVVSFAEQPIYAPTSEKPMGKHINQWIIHKVEENTSGQSINTCQHMIGSIDESEQWFSELLRRETPNGVIITFYKFIN